MYAYFFVSLEDNKSLNILINLIFEIASFYKMHVH